MQGIIHLWPLSIDLWSSPCSWVWADNLPLAVYKKNLYILKSYNIIQFTYIGLIDSVVKTL